MVRGHGADRAIADSLTKKYKIPVTVATIAQVDAFRALGMKKLVGITYFQDDMNARFAKFLQDDGFDVKAMKGIDVPFKDAGKLAPEAIYNFAKKVFLEHGPADGIYMPTLKILIFSTWPAMPGVCWGFSLIRFCLSRTST